MSEQDYSSEAFFQWMCGPADMPFPDKNTKAPPIAEQIERGERRSFLNQCARLGDGPNPRFRRVKGEIDRSIRWGENSATLTLSSGVALTVRCGPKDAQWLSRREGIAEKVLQENEIGTRKHILLLAQMVSTEFGGIKGVPEAEDLEAEVLPVDEDRLMIILFRLLPRNLLTGL